MPKKTGLEGTIPELYRVNTLNALMFGHVTGCRAILHTVTLKQAITSFMEVFGLTDEDYNADSALVTYDRMRKDLLKLKKSK